MFKIPEWGKDVPKSNVNFEKTTQPRKSKKTKVGTSDASLPKTTVSGNVKTNNTKNVPKKSTDKRKIKKIRQKNRAIYAKLSNNSINESESNSNQPGRFVMNPNKQQTVSPPQKKQLTNPKITERKVNTKKKRNKKNQNDRKPIQNDNNEMKKKPKKRKHSSTESNKDSIYNIELTDMDTDKSDEILINAKKKKLDDVFKQEDQEAELFKESIPKQSKIDRKKLALKNILERQNANRNVINVSGNNLRDRMMAKLQAAQFRYLNEKLYTSSGSEAKQLFQEDPTAFNTYHQGYQQQLKKWPINPLDVIVKKIIKLPKTHLVADMGCGEASLSKRIPHKVRSFDLVATAPNVEVCDMARTPLLTASMDVAVYCLALMGTDLAQYLAEANRILKQGGLLIIAEVESRFEKVDDFIRDVQRLGFKLLKLDKNQEVFFFMEFKKNQDAPKRSKQPNITLKPCLYKRR